MRTPPRVQALIRFACAALLIGCSLWTTWVSATYWAPCMGAAWNDMNPSCAEAMSSFTLELPFNLWAASVALVGVLVLTRVVPRGWATAVALTAVLVACPILDDGFFWIEWGSADGTPGQGLWVACWFAVTALALVYPFRDASLRTRERASVEEAVQQRE